MKDSFLKKLKKGMDTDQVEEVGVNVEKKKETSSIKEIPVDFEAQKPSSLPAFAKAKPVKATKAKLKETDEKEEEEDIEIKNKPVVAPVVRKKADPAKTPIVTKKSASTKDKDKWPTAEGQLAVDIYQTEKDLVIQSAIAGVKPDNLDITIEEDLLSIKGERKRPERRLFFARMLLGKIFSSNYLTGRS
jgi:HSP20 family molecular chaperone IbpA